MKPRVAANQLGGDCFRVLDLVVFLVDKVFEDCPKILRHSPRPGGLPYLSVTLDANADERRVIELLRELKAAGYTLRQIADELNRQGFTTRRGTAWRHQYVAGLAA